MRVYPDFRLQLMHNNKWLVITHAWDLSSLEPQIKIYTNKGMVFRVQRLINGRYKKNEKNSQKRLTYEIFSVYS